LPGEVAARDPLADRLSKLDGGRVLDVATGSGSFIGYLAESFKTYESFTGIDNREEPLEAARKAFAGEPLSAIRRASFQRADAVDLPFPDCSFDTVAIANSLHHLSEVDLALVEVLRALKPGGLCVVREMHRDNPTPPQLTHVLMHDWWGEVNTRQGQFHRPSFTRAEIQGILGRLALPGMEVLDLPGDKRDPKDKKTLDFLCERNLELAESMKEEEDYGDFKTKALELNRRAREYGFLPADAVGALGRKP